MSTGLFKKKKKKIYISQRNSTLYTIINNFNMQNCSMLIVVQEPSYQHKLIHKYKKLYTFDPNLCKRKYTLEIKGQVKCIELWDIEILAYCLYIACILCIYCIQPTIIKNIM